MIVLIPAYEPTEKMLKLVAQLKEKTDYKILIVDDGSGDSFSQLFNKAEEDGCIVLHHPVNKGKGAALKTGFSYIHSNCEPDKVVCADSDGQHHVNDIIKLADAIDSNKPEMVLGVRQFEGDVPFKSRFGNSISAFTFKMATGIVLNDTQTGLRGYPYELLPWLCSVQGERFEYEQNLLLKSKKSGISIKQLPIATIYDNNNKGTHFRPINDSISVLLPILKFCSSSILSFCIDFVLLLAFNKLLGGLFFCIVFARVISSTFNYIVNKVFVFDAKDTSTKQSAPKYFGLALAILSLNYCMMKLFIEVIHMHIIPAKILTEITLFTISYTVQKLFIFKKDNDIKLTPS
ncbi:bifunctional glycosyltransferase family 2/GtrA family protein [Pseudobacteroides cellulosolvens]|uniref:Glycosyl transferase family 2 n=1 Tax=Pseudobacteroides cellulosolvens ATCC 35603 = DSM 2933 TaxID=398512 RepID=A0A0L6JKQ2_9FIRM|nr:bifunctional glycosyltransferase family 2/GtrA family protein [Pseudobacteroides cellulosolvens]KNY26411.1 glycosyl transferase family 2 [Pseudobacteroides cellulosolvens ATCC 35603 = DSM 2933]